MFGKTLDKMFDLSSLFTYNHIWFLNSKVFSNSNFDPPDYDESNMPISGPFFFGDQQGGLEDVRQKLWTLVTLMIIKVAAQP